MESNPFFSPLGRYLYLLYLCRNNMPCLCTRSCVRFDAEAVSCSFSFFVPPVRLFVSGASRSLRQASCHGLHSEPESSRSSCWVCQLSCSFALGRRPGAVRGYVNQFPSLSASQRFFPCQVEVELISKELSRVASFFLASPRSYPLGMRMRGLYSLF